jgi:hypothetical protein
VIRAERREGAAPSRYEVLVLVLRRVLLPDVERVRAVEAFLSPAREDVEPPVRLLAVERDVLVRFLSGAVASAADATDNRYNRDISRALRRAAALRWMMPFWAALSRARTASRTTSAMPSPPAVTAAVAFLVNVRTAERAPWLRSARLSA